MTLLVFRKASLLLIQSIHGLMKPSPQRGSVGVVRAWMGGYRFVVSGGSGMYSSQTSVEAVLAEPVIAEQKFS